MKGSGLSKKMVACNDESRCVGYSLNIRDINNRRRDTLRFTHLKF